MAVAVAVAVGSSEGAGAAGRNCSGSWLGKGRHGLKTKRGWLARRLAEHRRAIVEHAPDVPPPRAGTALHAGAGPAALCTPVTRSVSRLTARILTALAGAAQALGASLSARLAHAALGELAAGRRPQ
jgi:hypothetical protein